MVTGLEFFYPLTDTGRHFNYNSFIAGIQLKVDITFKFVASPMTKPNVELQLARESTIVSQVMASKHIAEVWEKNQ